MGVCVNKNCNEYCEQYMVAIEVQAAIPLPSGKRAVLEITE